MEGPQKILEQKEDTVDVEFTLKVVDNRLPGVYVSNDGSNVFCVFYKKRYLFGKSKDFLIDHFRIADEGKRLSYEEALQQAKSFFEAYFRNKVLQRAYAEIIVKI